MPCEAEKITALAHEAYQLKFIPGFVASFLQSATSYGMIGIALPASFIANVGLLLQIEHATHKLSSLELMTVLATLHPLIVLPIFKILTLLELTYSQTTAPRSGSAYITLTQTFYNLDFVMSSALPRSQSILLANDVPIVSGSL